MTLQPAPETARAIARQMLEPTHALTDRFRSELSVAATLCELHPARRAAWERLIAQAAALVQRAAGSGSLPALRDAVRKAESLLAPIGAVAKTYTLYCAGHAHIDMNWMWSWPETVAVTHDTFGTVLSLMDEFPAFRFSQSQASVYAILERHNPAMLARIAERVREGRWEVTASHWVETDKNMAGGEALCRHVLYTRRYMQKLFGLTPEDVPIDWSPDTFGHAVSVPTYLARAGIRYLYLHRPGVNTQPKPHAFWWEGRDGARVLVRNDMTVGYNGVIAPEHVLPHLWSAVRQTGARAALYVYGVGDHGGGPTRRDVVRGLELDSWPVFPKVLFSTAVDYYRRLEREGRNLPVLTGELNTEVAGCYTTQSLIKRSNRVAENRLADAEAAAAIAWAGLGHAYPRADFEEGWRDTLFCHFHDILPGSGVHDTRTYAHGLFQKTMATTGMEEAKALRALAAQVDTRAAAAGSVEPPGLAGAAQGAGVGFQSRDGMLSQAEQSAGSGARPFLLFNPTAWERREVMEVTVWDGPSHHVGTPLRSRPLAVRDPHGRILPVQLVDQGHYWGHEFVKLSFPVTVPGLGYALYTVLEQEAPPADAAASQLGRSHHCFYLITEREGQGLENEFLRLELDMQLGGIRSLIDRRTGAELILPGAAASLLEYSVERPHGMTAWLIDNAGPVERPAVLSVAQRLKGPYRASIDVRCRIRESEFTLTYELRAGDPRLHLQCRGTWFQRGSPEHGVPNLRLALPLALDDARATYEVPFGALERRAKPDEEVPALQWALVRGRIGQRRAGVLLANDSKHGHALAGSTLRLNLVRAGYDPDPLPEIGSHEIGLTLQALPDGGTVPEAVQAGCALNQPLRAVGTGVHAGTWPVAAQLLAVEPAAVRLLCAKQAEDGEALVLRLSNLTGKAVAAKVSLHERLAGRKLRAAALDLMERPVKDASVKAAGRTVSVRVPAWGITTLRLERG